MRKNLLSLGLMLTLAACGTPPETNQPGASTRVDAVEPERVTVSHPRELRGVWVATVSRLDWPPSTTLTPEQGRQSLDTLVDELDKAGFNA
ncbi:MAG TPA: hypothetical protein VEU50_06860, partial [Archangium sp.]|nr:hypothetical protein [Archangium sp.]